MTTPSKGIGRGGLRNPPGGRPKGSIGKKALARIAEAEATGALLPLDWLLNRLRDPEATPRERDWAAIHAAPYMHARLSALKVFNNPKYLDDTALIREIHQLERAAAEVPEAER